MFFTQFFFKYIYFIIFLYIYSIRTLNHGQHPYKWFWDYAVANFFEAEGEIKFSPV
jgi:hypothetical protein